MGLFFWVCPLVCFTSFLKSSYIYGTYWPDCPPATAGELGHLLPGGVFSDGSWFHMDLDVELIVTGWCHCQPIVKYF